MNATLATRPTIRDIVLDGIRTIAAEQDIALAPLIDDCRLLETGLDSVGLALVATHLEDVTGCDPFASVTSERFPRTIGELVALYEEALVYPAALITYL